MGAILIRETRHPAPSHYLDYWPLLCQVCLILKFCQIAGAAHRLLHTLTYMLSYIESIDVQARF